MHPGATQTLTIALTGGIGAGKSTAARIMGEFGAYVIDWDDVARAVQQPGEAAWQQIAQRWPQVIGADRQIDRAALGAIVFADHEQLSALEAITHPAIRRAAFAQGARASWQAGSLAEHMVVHEIPLLVESGLADRFDVVVSVEAPSELRIDRLQQSRAMTAQQAAARIQAQASDTERRAIATYTLDSSGTISEMRRDIHALLTQLRSDLNERNTR